MEKTKKNTFFQKRTGEVIENKGSGPKSEPERTGNRSGEVVENTFLWKKRTENEPEKASASPSWFPRRRARAASARKLIVEPRPDVSGTPPARLGALPDKKIEKTLQDNCLTHPSRQGNLGVSQEQAKECCMPFYDSHSISRRLVQRPRRGSSQPVLMIRI